MSTDLDRPSLIAMERASVALLIVDVWRISKRAVRDGAPESVRIACDRAIERVVALGFEIDEMLGKPYHENMRATVLHRNGDGQDPIISECISPAVYHSGNGKRELIRPAEVIISGGIEDEP